MYITSLPKLILFSFISLDKADNSNICVTNEKYILSYAFSIPIVRSEIF